MELVSTSSWKRIKGVNFSLLGPEELVRAPSCAGSAPVPGDTHVSRVCARVSAPLSVVPPPIARLLDESPAARDLVDKAHSPDFEALL